MTRYVVILQTLLLLFIAADCRKSPNPVGPTPPDTTSNNFTFTKYTFGGDAGSSGFKDVAIINDSDIWAVGAIYTAPDTMYNAAHWDGENWSLKRIPYYYQGEPLYSSINTVFAFDSNDVWFGIGSMIHWDGQTFNAIDNSKVWGPHSVYKMWGTSGSNFYIVGTGGSIAHYSDGNWTKMESGTTIDLRDVWGTPDGSVVWACGWSNDESQSILLKYDGTSWKTVWSRNGTEVSPYGYFVTSVWATDSLFLSSGRGVFRDTTQVATLPWFPYRIRGTANDNIAVAGDEGMIWHWNGADWKQLNLQSGEPLYSMAISGSMLVAVGSDFNIGLQIGAGLIYIGREQ